VPLSCSSSQPLAIAQSRPALYSAGVPLSSNRNGPVDLLDIDPAVLDGLKCVGEFDDLAGGDLRIGEGSAGDEFHTAAIGVGCRSYIGHKRLFCNGPTSGLTSLLHKIHQDYVRFKRYFEGGTLSITKGSGSP